MLGCRVDFCVVYFLDSCGSVIDLCATEHKTMITEDFIDGDLVERFLDFSQTQMEEVCRGLKVHVYMTLLEIIIP